MKLEPAQCLARFMEAPAGRFWPGDSFFYWCASPTLFGFSLWGRPSAADLERLCAALLVVAGFYAVLDSPYPTRDFGDLGPALNWLGVEASAGRRSPRAAPASRSRRASPRRSTSAPPSGRSRGSRPRSFAARNEKRRRGSWLVAASAFSCRTAG